MAREKSKGTLGHLPWEESRVSIKKIDPTGSIQTRLAASLIGAAPVDGGGFYARDRLHWIFKRLRIAPKGGLQRANTWPDPYDPAKFRTEKKTGGTNPTGLFELQRLQRWLRVLHRVSTGPLDSQRTA
ncbi:hypothetical protein CRG98_009929 [Punica granatum]|uniref:Uncharacterized protein n=1 Tax=Punica granatum TaxID=22663 RepID=A0A2I0KMF2_PUNGR|nr:hypothetical protein CRG98_009929 [Punica granatum]